MDFNKILSIITYAGLVGLVILNFGGAVAIIGALGTQATDYVKAVQGRPATGVAA